MQQNLIIAETTLSHHCRSYLTQPHSMPPACAFEHKARRHLLRIEVDTLHHESRTIKMRRAQGTANLELFPDD